MIEGSIENSMHLCHEAYVGHSLLLSAVIQPRAESLRRHEQHEPP